MLRRRDLIAAGLAGLAWPGLAHAQASNKRHALVIGNDRYGAGVGELRNAVNDATLVSSILRQCGFVLPAGGPVANTSRETMMAAVRAHAERLKRAGEDAIGFFYYAGHGAARPNGGNYLIPIVDVDMTSLALWDKSVALDWLFADALADVPCAQIVAIDACRNELRMPNRGVGGVGSFKSVRGIEASPSRPANMFLSFATWEGQTAFDGGASDSNGPYATALARYLRQKGKVIELFDDVRVDVLERTQQVQEPMNLSRLNRDSRNVVFNETAVATLSNGLDVTPAEERDKKPKNHALVMSCRYPDQFSLPRTQSDGDRVGSALKASDFAVTRRMDANRQEMMQLVTDFTAQLGEAGSAAVGVLYFAGYGSSVDGHNYLLPNGPLPGTPEELVQKGVAVEQLIRTLEQARARAIAVLIDCGRELQYLNAKAIERGFAEQFGANNVVLAFSTTPGTYAQDGPDGSRFAAALADEIRQPERRHLEEMLLAVRARVETDTNRRMVPAFVSSAKTPIYFREGRALDVNR